MALTPMYNRQMGLKYIYAFYTGEIDYKEGPLMKAAYGSIQKKYGLTVDKIYGPKTDAVLRDLVKQLQTLLDQRGYDLTVDGLFGPATLEAVKAFQKKNGLAVDGIAGPEQPAKQIPGMTLNISSAMSSAAPAESVTDFL